MRYRLSRKEFIIQILLLRKTRHSNQTISMNDFPTRNKRALTIMSLLLIPMIQPRLLALHAVTEVRIHPWIMIWVQVSGTSAFLFSKNASV